MPKGRAKTNNKKVLNQASLAAGTIIENIVTLTKGGKTQSTKKQDQNDASVTDAKSTSKSFACNQSDLKVGMLKLHKYISDVVCCNFFSFTLC